MSEIVLPFVTIGLAMIMRNEAANLPRILQEITDSCDAAGQKTFDQIVLVDTGSTDNSKEIAASFPGVEVYDFTWCDHFSKAREFSFSKLHTDWSGWLDADDHIEGWEHVRQLIADVHRRGDISSTWFPYKYDRHQPSGAWVAIHSRERFVKRGEGWHWHGAVHEHLIRDAGPGPMAIVEQIWVEHWRDLSKDKERNERNIAILETQIAKDKKEARLWFDLGSQHYHGRNWDKAIHYYKGYLTAQKNGQDDIYQALHRLADCYRALGRPDNAQEYDRRALNRDPLIRDAYYGLAECAAMKGRWNEVITYNQMGRVKDLRTPNPVLVINPLDYEFHPLLVEHKALAMQGHLEEALAAATRALEIIPGHEELVHFQEQYRSQTAHWQAADQAIALAKNLPPDGAYAVYQALSPEVRQKKEVRDALVAPALVHLGAPDVTILCGDSLEEWGPETPQTTGIGGSETAVVAMARELGARGLNVRVYNMPGEQEGKYGNVSYIDYTRYTPEKPTKLFVAWRNFSFAAAAPPADHRWLWLHDLHVGPQFTKDYADKFTLIRPVSNSHAEHLKWLYPFLNGNLVPTRNGVDLERFTKGEVERQPYKCVWLSSPDRGLEHLLEMWPEVVARVPEAELTVFYGWQNLDIVAQRTGNTELARFREIITHKAEQLKGVHLAGRVNQDVLANELRSAAVLPYCTHFLETSFIGGLEAMGAGTLLISTVCGAIPETVGDAAPLIRGHPLSESYRRVFVTNLVGALEHPEVREPWVTRGLERVKDYSWSGVAQEWLDRIEQPA